MERNHAPSGRSLSLIGIFDRGVCGLDYYLPPRSLNQLKCPNQDAAVGLTLSGEVLPSRDSFDVAAMLLEGGFWAKTIPLREMVF